jgi:phage tail protein X/ribosomal protein L12E/L44/L45/RPP1/RPP2
MPIATFRGEKTVGEIADKLYLRLTPKQRETAEAAILKANPQLSDLRAVPKGAVLRVPDIPELRAKTNRNLENPDAQIAAMVGEALTAFGVRIDQHAQSADTEIKAQLALLKGKDIKAALANAPTLQAQAQSATEALTARGKAIAADQKALQAVLKQAISDLERTGKHA